ncbi:hypothetical protein ACFC5B_14240, partial [Enterococcus durans]
MTYKHLTIDELTMIESYYLQHNKPVEIANRMGRAIQTIYNVVGMATVFLTNFIRCRTSFRMLFRLSLTMSLLGCDDLRQELTV